MDKKLTVFLSYVSDDYHIVQELVQKLKENDFDVWIDKEKLTGGQRWSKAIDEMLGIVDFVIICFSTKSINKEGKYQQEINLAIDIDKTKPEGKDFIIPLKLDKCNIPKKLKQFQYINYYENDGFNKLLKAISIITPEAPVIRRDIESIAVPINTILQTDDYAYAPYSETPGCEIAVRLTPFFYPTGV